MGWFRGLFGKREPSALEAVSALLKGPPSPQLVGAIESVARELTEARLGKGLAHLRPRLILVFARQAEDAARKLSDSYWRSDQGHNVGIDVDRAYRAGLGAFLNVLDRRPRSKSPLQDAVAAIAALEPPLRIAPADPDGYGLATLGEIERDLTRLL
jgi:hypothetical protein